MIFSSFARALPFPLIQSHRLRVSSLTISFCNRNTFQNVHFRCNGGHYQNLPFPPANLVRYFSTQNTQERPAKTPAPANVGNPLAPVRRVIGVSGGLWAIVVAASANPMEKIGELAVGGGIAAIVTWMIGPLTAPVSKAMNSAEKVDWKRVVEDYFKKEKNPQDPPSEYEKLCGILRIPQDQRAAVALKIVELGVARAGVYGSQRPLIEAIQRYTEMSVLPASILASFVVALLEQILLVRADAKLALSTLGPEKAVSQRLSVYLKRLDRAADFDDLILEKIDSQPDFLTLEPEKAVAHILNVYLKHPDKATDLDITKLEKIYEQLYEIVELTRTPNDNRLAKEILSSDAFIKHLGLGQEQISIYKEAITQLPKPTQNPDSNIAILEKKHEELYALIELARSSGDNRPAKEILSSDVLMKHLIGRINLKLNPEQVSVIREAIAKLPEPSQDLKSFSNQMRELFRGLPYSLSRDFIALLAAAYMIQASDVSLLEKNLFYLLNMSMTTVFNNAVLKSRREANEFDGYQHFTTASSYTDKMFFRFLMTAVPLVSILNLRSFVLDALKASKSGGNDGASASPDVTTPTKLEDIPVSASSGADSVVQVGIENSNVSNLNYEEIVSSLERIFASENVDLMVQRLMELLS